MAGESGSRYRWLREAWASTIGKKIFVAITGVILAAYVVLHAVGNLKALQGNGGVGEAPINEYAEWLRTFGDPVLPEDSMLWFVRVILLAALIVHVVGITQLTRRSYAARPATYPAPRHVRSISSKTMLLTGSLLAAFIVFHVLQFTTATIQVTPVVLGDVYGNLHAAFQEWWLVAIYVLTVVLLGFHLRHALWSIFQTAGWDKPNRNNTIRRFATGTAVFVTLGFAAVPVSFLVGAMPEPQPHEELAAGASQEQVLEERRATAREGAR